MTVTCPSCQTRYRYPTGLSEGPKQARCSRCEATFPLAADVPSYRIGARLEPVSRATRQAAESAAAMAATADLAAAIEAARPASEAAPEAAPQAVPDSAMELAAAMAAGTTSSAEPELAAAGDAPAPVPRGGVGRAFLQLLTASAMASGGAGAGYYGAMVQQQDMLTWTAAGAGVGLLLGWMSVRWMARTR